MLLSRVWCVERATMVRGTSTPVTQPTWAPGEWWSLVCRTVACRPRFVCEASTGACTADTIRVHMLRSVDFQIVESSPAAEVSQCTTPLEDAQAGRMLCEVLAATEAIQPTFGHSLGNTWLAAPESGLGSFDGCNFTSPASWRQCVGSNIAKQAVLLVERAPHLLLNAGLMEYLSKSNLDDPVDFESKCCVPGTVGQWGGNDTCVPDVQTQCIQEYYTEWGKVRNACIQCWICVPSRHDRMLAVTHIPPAHLALPNATAEQVFMDAGVRSFFFGQSRLTGGGRGCNIDGTGCSRVSAAGAAGFGVVLGNLKAYAVDRSYGSVWFGPQAASGFELANGTELADWVYGAQHLHSRQQWLVQPFGVNGTSPQYGPQWYGGGDTHDANRVNNAKALPVMLDFDNFSGDEDRPDDIRRLSSWPNATRSQFVQTLWHIARLYSPSVTVSVPMSKAAGGNWPAFSQPQGQCWSGAWGDRADGLYFGVYSCGLVNATARLFLGPEQPSVEQVSRLFRAASHPLSG
jgi:hypothetical protein